MARLIDTDGTVVAETTSLEDLVTEEVVEEEQVAPEPEATEEPVVEDEESALPEKYQGKSAAEIARMHSELELRLGQQSNEVGELRRAFDDMVQQQLAAKAVPTTPEPTEPVEEIDFFADPQAAIAQAVSNHPSLKQAEAVAKEMAKSQSLARLKEAHPDMQEILSTEDFRNWVKASPYRQQMYVQADQQYDFGAANELLSLYKDRAGVKQAVQKVEKVAQKQQAKKAATGSARAASPVGAKKKTYRRADLIELRKTNPKRYEALASEIMAAYAEGRVS